MRDEVLVLGDVGQLHHSFVVKIQKFFVQKGECLNCRIGIAEIENRHCHLAKVTRNKQL